MRPTTLILLGLLGLTALAYAPVRTASFVYEDENAVFANPAVLGQAPQALDRARWLSALSHRWVFLISRQPRASHLVNLGLHLVNGTLVWAIAGALMPPVAAVLVAACFLLHPIQTEAVAYVASRSELLAACFALSAFLLYTTAQGRRWRVVATWGLVLLAVSAKENAAVIVPLMVLFDGVVHRRWSLWRTAILLVPVAAMALSVLRFDYTAASELTVLDYSATQATALWRYLALVVVPWGQSLDHDFDLVPWAVRYVALAGVGLVALIPLGASLALLDESGRHERLIDWWGGGTRPLVLAWGLVWLLVSLAPRVILRVPEYLNEHQLYLPLIGVWLILGASLGAFIQETTHGSTETYVGPIQPC